MCPLVYLKALDTFQGHIGMNWQNQNSSPSLSNTYMHTLSSGLEENHELRQQLQAKLTDPSSMQPFLLYPNKISIRKCEEFLEEATVMVQTKGMAEGRRQKRDFNYREKRTQ